MLLGLITTANFANVAGTKNNREFCECCRDLKQPRITRMLQGLKKRISFAQFAVEKKENHSRNSRLKKRESFAKFAVGNKENIIRAIRGFKIKNDLE